MPFFFLILFTAASCQDWVVSRQVWFLHAAFMASYLEISAAICSSAVSAISATGAAVCGRAGGGARGRGTVTRGGLERSGGETESARGEGGHADGERERARFGCARVLDERERSTRAGVRLANRARSRRGVGRAGKNTHRGEGDDDGGERGDGDARGVLGGRGVGVLARGRGDGTNRCGATGGGAALGADARATRADERRGDDGRHDHEWFVRAREPGVEGARVCARRGSARTRPRPGKSRARTHQASNRCSEGAKSREIASTSHWPVSRRTISPRFRADDGKARKSVDPSDFQLLGS